MKKFLLFIALCVATLTASAQEVVYPNGDRICTFEGGTNNYWAGKIDSPQYDGPLLYSQDSTYIYSWYDPATQLCSAIPLNYGKHWYSGGGEAISNYWSGILARGDYEHQLEVIAPNQPFGTGGRGYNHSDNFAVHYGYKDGSTYNQTVTLPSIEFADHVARKIKEMYVNNTTYFVNVARNGNSFCPAMTQGKYVQAVAIGHHADGTTVTVPFTLAANTNQVISWTRWNLESLGEVVKVEFNVVGNVNTSFGFAMPAYFCYDNIKVDYTINQEVEGPTLAPAKSMKAPGEEHKMFVSISNNLISGDVPEGCSFTLDTPNTIAIRLDEGQKNVLTVNGLPANARITGITASAFCDDLFGASTITAKLGDEVIGSVDFCGMFMEHGNVIFGSYEQDIPLVLNDGDHFVGNNSFTISGECIASLTVIDGYTISYVLEDSNDEPAVATFEDLALEPESYWAGDEDGDDWMDEMGYYAQIKSGAYSFDNYYVPDWMYWFGYGISNRTSTEYKALTDQYNSCVGSGVNGSANYLVAYPDGSMWGENPMIRVEGEAKVVPGFYITNTAWVVDAIQNGDGQTPGAFGVGDYFKITIHAVDADGTEIATRDFCLADYRFENEADRYYVSDWQYVDLSQLGEAAAFYFTFDGSRKNAYGLTTPTYFCIDDFGGEGSEDVREEGDVTVGIQSVSFETRPVNGIFTIDGRRLQNANRPGLYIINGKKVMVK